MYSILIVDDEKNVTETLKESIPWANLGVDHVYTAGNGYQALGILSNIHVDLVIADIQMPHMDGLELVREIRNAYPGLHCIFLTAYDRFEYALQALKLGVDNYILKPISMIEITQTIESSLDNLYAERENLDMIFQESMIRRWLNGNISSNELTEKASFLPVSVYLHNYAVLAVSSTVEADAIRSFLEECKTIFSERYDSALLCENYSRYVFLIGGKQISPEFICDTLRGLVQKYEMEETVDCVISQIVTDFMKVQLCYRNVTEFLNVPHTGNEGKRIHIIESHYPSAGSNDPVLRNDLSPIIRRTKAFIEKHYAEGISLKTISSQLNVNTAYLGYLFKKEMGVYFNTYLNDFRVDRAAELLRGSAYSIAEIAAMVGFVTSSHFITTFKKKYGVPPLKYRMLQFDE